MNNHDKPEQRFWRIARYTARYALYAAGGIALSAGIAWLVAFVSWWFIVPVAIIGLVAMAMYKVAVEEQ